MNLLETVSQPPPETTAPIEPAAVANVGDLVGSNQPEQQKQPESVDVGDLVGSKQPEQSEQSEQSPKSVPTVPTVESKGCQCARCRASSRGPNRGGRHHKDCPCHKCTGTADSPDFTDLSTTPEMVEPAVDYQAMSEMLFDMSAAGLCGFFGPEWQPKSKEERDAVCVAIRKYCQTKQMKDIPPGLMLTIVLSIYAAPRLQEKSTAGKLRMLWDRAKMGWFWFRSKFQRKPKIIRLSSEQNEQPKAREA